MILIQVKIDPNTLDMSLTVLLQMAIKRVPMAE